MATTFDVDYAAPLADTAFGAGGTTTGEGGRATDNAGNVARIISGLLEIHGGQDPSKSVTFPGTIVETAQGIRAYFRPMDLPIGTDISLFIAKQASGIFYNVLFWNFYSTTNQSLLIRRDYYFELSGGATSNNNIFGPLHPTQGYPLTDTLYVELVRSAVNNSVLRAEVYNVTQGRSLGFCTGTDATGPNQNAGPAGFVTSAQSGSGPARYSRVIITDTPSAPALVPGTVTRISRSATSNTFRALAGSGGTGAITVDVYVGDISGFNEDVDGALLASSAVFPFDFAHDPGAGQTKYLKFRYRDSGTPQQKGYDRQVPSARYLPPQAMRSFNVLSTPVKLGHTGDSRTRWDTAPTNYVTKMGEFIDPFVGAVSLSNRGSNGTTTANWLPNAPASDDGLIFNLSVTAYNAIGATEIFIALGINDANVSSRHSKATYKANLNTIITAYFAQVPTLVRVNLVRILYAVPDVYPVAPASVAFDEATLTLIPQYHAAQDEIVAASGGTVFIFGEDLYQRTAAEDGDVYEDGIHQTIAFRTQMGILFANEYLLRTNGLAPNVGGSNGFYWNGALIGTTRLIGSSRGSSISKRGGIG